MNYDYQTLFGFALVLLWGWTLLAMPVLAGWFEDEPAQGVDEDDL